MNKWFNSFADRVSSLTGRSYTFVTAVSIILIWACSGPLLGFSDTWQLIINTLTTLITFLMVFVIQNTQNKTANSQQIKLNLILQLLGMNDEDVRKLELLSDKELEEILKEVQENNYKQKGS